MHNKDNYIFTNTAQIKACTETKVLIHMYVFYFGQTDRLKCVDVKLVSDL